MKATGAGRALGLVGVVIGVLATMGVLTFAGPCVHDDGGHGMCFDASLAVAVLGGLVAIGCIATLFLRSGKAAGVVALCVAACGALMVASPGTLFGLCMMETMRCWTIMRPFAMLCGIVVVCVALVQAILLFRRRSVG